MFSIYALCSVAEMQAGDRSVTSQSEPDRYRQNRTGKKGCINGRCSTAQGSSTLAPYTEVRGAKSPGRDRGQPDRCLMAQTFRV